MERTSPKRQSTETPLEVPADATVGNDASSVENTDASGNSSARPGSELIARRAYERFEERGHEHGHDLDDWLEAERELSRDGTS